MKLRRQPSPLLLLLLPSLASPLAVTPGETSLAAQKAPQETSLAVPPITAVGKADVGVKDIPVDGQDGKPHAGPWVETAGERERKKVKPGEEEEEVSSVGKKPAPKPLKDTPSGEGKQIPESNNGVMDDRNRAVPKEGTTGTEGGVSEKNRDRKAQEGQTGEKVEKKPDPPKEAPPLPHSEQEKITSKESKEADKKSKDKEKGMSLEEVEKPKGAVGLEKPADLPDKPHDLPQPGPNTSPKDDALDLGKDQSKSSIPSGSVDNIGLIQPLHSFVLSLAMIIFSEIGDKTFLIAALMAMKHDRMLVFSAAFSALIAMTILSAVLGHAVPTLIPKRFTSFLAALLFLIFGAKMLREGLAISPNEGVSEEMREVEMELEEKEISARQKGRRRSSISPYILESGRGIRKSRSNSRLPSPPRSPSSSLSRSPSPHSSRITGALSGLTNLFSLLLSPAWVQTFVMTFLGEWGDRSQIATIAMAAGQDYWWVTGGAVSGHALCTAAAVIGGRAIAGRVSLRVVTLGGAGAFLIFGVIYLVEAIYYP
ncbi:MAG: hypothetical protein M1827_007408 [Pycnora praestabilis]|nr:MAG: hypothetical protein M1827_007408 [Pycnora praestabilis]